jgi:serine/threonine protein phosphatase 1
MIKALINALLGKAPPAADAPRRRMYAEKSPAALYAIGDVHGHLNLLKDLERQIIADAKSITGEKWLVMLGDYIDRGPQSAAVLDHLQQPMTTGWRRICICGNHEHAMSAAMKSRKAYLQWLQFGGIETLMSYGIDHAQIQSAGQDNSAHARLVEAYIPLEHIRFVEQLPILLELPGYVFVHAGLRPNVPLVSQLDDDLLWLREARSDYDFGALVVHGHTPVAEPILGPFVINIDTGAYATGVLTGIYLGEELRLLQSKSVSAPLLRQNTMREAPSPYKKDTSNG